MDAKPTMVRLSEETRQRIKALVGTYGMAIFIREAVEKALAEREAAAPAPELKRRTHPRPNPKTPSSKPD